MRMLYKHGTSKIQVDGVPVVPVPFYEALDGKTSSDYEQRVEPSSQGGEKLANLILDYLEPELPSCLSYAQNHTTMSDRGAPDPVPNARHVNPEAVMPAAVHVKQAEARR